MDNKKFNQLIYRAEYTGMSFTMSLKLSSSCTLTDCGPFTSMQASKALGTMEKSCVLSLKINDR